jgi:hypothetical protein
MQLLTIHYVQRGKQSGGKWVISIESLRVSVLIKNNTSINLDLPTEVINKICEIIYDHVEMVTKSGIIHPTDGKC